MVPEGVAGAAFLDVYRFQDFDLHSGPLGLTAIPVGVAWLMRSSASDAATVFYPSPAGATESLLPMEYGDLLAEVPALGTLQPDVQALLVRFEHGAGLGPASGLPADGRPADGRPAAPAAENFIVPVDRCYELVGLLRRVWRGFDGGSDAHARLAEFFERLRADARPAHEPSHTPATRMRDLRSQHCGRDRRPSRRRRRCSSISA